MSAVEEYLHRVSRGMAGMDPRIREDVLRELRSHLSDAAAESDEARAVAAAELPAIVAGRYKAMYGYGPLVRSGLAGLAGVLAVFTLPLGLYAGIGTLSFTLAIVTLIALVAYLMAVAVKAGSGTGLAAGATAGVVRIASLAVFQSIAGAVVPDASGLGLFVAVSAVLVLIGFVPGRAREVWRPPDVSM